MPSAFAPHPGMKVFLIGIGGVSMCALAEVLHHRGLSVSGSDITSGPVTDRLEELGIPVTLGHSAQNVRDVDAIIRTAAAKDDNAEVVEARRQGLPVYERAEAWGVLMREHTQALCIAGTHGKTTTTSMMTHVSLAAKQDPTVMIGGALPLIGGGHRVGNGELIIMEACEYCRSFLNFSPTLAVVLNIEADHLDCFRDLDDILDAFRQFALKTPPETGTLLLNADDKNTMDALAGLPRQILTFGLAESADVRAVNLTEPGGCASFDVTVRGKHWCHVDLRMPGRHNVSNALAAAAAAYVLDLPGDAVSRGLGGFTGAKRRFEDKGTFHGARVVEDYAHHPSEIEATLHAARQIGAKRVVTVFQPHTYSRTKALFNDFVRVLGGSDEVIVSEIYAAREKNVYGVTGRTLADALPGGVFCPTMDDIAEHLAQTTQPGDLILVMGAGDIGKLSDLLVRAEKEQTVAAR